MGNSNSVIEDNFINKFLPQLIQAYSTPKFSQYVSDSPKQLTLPQTITKNVYKVLKKLTLDLTESNLELVINSTETGLQYDPYGGEIYNNDLNTLHVPSDKIIIYALKSSEFPTVQEIAFAENNKYHLAIRVFGNGIVLAYGHPQGNLNTLLQEKKAKAFKLNGEDAWSNIIENYPEWYYDMPRINIDLNRKKLVKDLNRISDLYSIPIYLPLHTLDFEYKNSIKAFVEDVNALEHINIESSNIIEMIKLLNSWGFYKDVLKDLA